MHDLTMTSRAPMLASLRDEWTARGWSLDDLRLFRMGPEEDAAAAAAAEAEAAAAAEAEAAAAAAAANEKTPEQKLADALAEAEKWKGLSRKHETNAKTNADKAKEFDAFKASQMSDTEKAVEDAKKAGRAEALAETGKVLAGAEIRVALTGVVPDPAEIVEDLDLSKYLTDTGEVDTEKVQKLRSKYEAMAKPVKGGPNLMQGNRGGDAPAQLTRADMAAMSPEQIVKARQEGRLNEVLGIKST